MRLTPLIHIQLGLLSDMKTVLKTSKKNMLSCQGLPYACVVFHLPNFARLCFPSRLRYQLENRLGFLNDFYLSAKLKINDSG